MNCISDSHADSQTNKSPNFTNLPEALRKLPQWCVAASDKSPRTVNGHNARVNDPSTWTDFKSAREAAHKKGHYIGFVLTEDDPFTCIDLDIKESTPPEHIQRCNNIVEKFNSYTERSVSGKGFHVWIQGKSIKGRKRDGVEVYSQGRFIICTGNVVCEKPIENRQELLDRLVGEMGIPHSPKNLPHSLNLPGEDISDFALADRAAMDEGELGHLFRGEWEGRYPSQSEADLALVKFLLPDTETPRECWRTFQLSRLGERDKARRSDYAKSTIAIAIQHLKDDAEKAQHGRQLADTILRHLSADSSRYFQLLGDDDLDRLPSPRWMVKGIVPETGIGTLFGSSGTFKSFLALDLLAHVSNGQPWFGRRVTAAPAVYVPFEGHGGIPKRVAAWRLAREQQGHHGARTNIRVITDPMNLRRQDDRDKLVATLIDRGWAGGMLCIDTLAQAGIGIDENTSQGMGEMIGIFQELQQRIGGVVLVVHHTGKSEKAGMRGWSGLLGALDFAINCWRDESWNKFDAQFVLDKIKDGESGTSIDFNMKIINLGVDEEGDYVTSLAVNPSIPQQRKITIDDSEIARNDDTFIEAWVRKEMADGHHPTGRSLEAQRAHMKAQRSLTQIRLRQAIDRLKNEGRLSEEGNGPSGNKWLRAIDVLQVATA